MKVFSSNGRETMKWVTPDLAGNPCQRNPFYCFREKREGFFYFFSVVLFYFILFYILLYVYIYYNKKNDWRRLKGTFGNKNCFKKNYLKIY